MKACSPNKIKVLSVIFGNKHEFACDVNAQKHITLHVFPAFTSVMLLLLIVISTELYNLM